MDKTIKTVLVIIVLALIIWGITSLPGSEPAQGEPIKIGVIAPLTGDMSNWGESMKNGIEIATNELNDQGGIDGRKVEIIVEDNKACDNTTTVSAFNKLVDIDKVKAVIVGCSGAVLSVAPIAEQNKIILLTTVASAAKISDAGDYVFRVCVSDAVQGKNLGDYIANRLDKKSVGVIYVNNDYGVGFFNNFKNSFENNGGDIVQSEIYEANATDFRTNLVKIKQADPEALVVINYGSEGGIIAKQARELGINYQIIGSDNFGVKEVIDAGGNFVEGAIFVTSVLDDNKKETKELKQKHLDYYKNEPSIMIAVATSYDGMNLLLNAIKSEGYNTDSIKDFLYSVEDYNGASGLITIDENGDAQMGSTIQIIKDGQFVPYEE